MMKIDNLLTIILSNFFTATMKRKLNCYMLAPKGLKPETKKVFITKDCGKFYDTSDAECKLLYTQED